MDSLRERAARFWAGEGGGREVLALAYPLVLSQLTFTLQTTMDRVFLTWYSAEAMAGAVTGLFVTYALLGVALGTGEYVTTFVAQYHGAGRPERIGAAMWQGIYFAAAAALLLALSSPLAGPVFDWAGHAPGLRVHEVAFARVFLLGAFPLVLMPTLASFFAGRGDTLVVLLVNVLTMAVNAVLDVAWIFGRFGFPRWGVSGAAWATVASAAVGSGAFLALMLRRGHRQRFRTLAAWRLDVGLFRRLVRYGLPSGLQFSLEILAFSLFMMIVGRIDVDALAASSIAFNLNMIVFMPMLGLGVAVSTLVGRSLGADRPAAAERATWSAFAMSLVYMLACGAVYVLAPNVLLAPYAVGAAPLAFARLRATTIVLLRFVAFYSIFDMMNAVFAAGLKGAGDTAFPLVATASLAWGAMLLPAYVACVRMGAGVYTAWSLVAAYVFVLGFLMLGRFRAGRWKSLRVVEAAPES